MTPIFISLPQTTLVMSLKSCLSAWRLYENGLKLNLSKGELLSFHWDFLSSPVMSLYWIVRALKKAGPWSGGSSGLMAPNRAKWDLCLIWADGSVKTQSRESGFSHSFSHLVIFRLDFWNMLLMGPPLKIVQQLQWPAPLLIGIETHCANGAVFSLTASPIPFS